MKLEHYSLNQPQGLNGWRSWLRRACEAIATAVGGPLAGAVVTAVFAIIDDLDTNNSWKRLTIDGSSIPENWTPSFDEENTLDAYVEKDAKPFMAFVTNIMALIQNSSNYNEQLDHYNNLVRSYELFKEYHKKNRIRGLSENAVKAKIETINVFMREIVTQLNQLFNIDANTIEVKAYDAFAVGDNILIGGGALTLPVTAQFSISFNRYEIKTTNVTNPTTGNTNTTPINVTVTNPTTGATTTTSPNSGSSVIKLPNTPATGTINPTTKTYLGGIINFKEKPLQSIAIVVIGIFGIRKILK